MNEASGRTGVIGLGAMGRAVASRLLEAGRTVTVWNRSPDPAASLAARGAAVAADPASALAHGFALSLLLDDAAVRSVFLEGDALDHAPPGTIHLCMSSISTATAAALAAAHAERSLHLVGAPVFGRPEAASAGRLEIVLAGERAVLDRVEPWLAPLGRVWRAGDAAPAAHLVKTAGNFMIGAAIEAMAEAAALVSRGGGDPATFLAMLGETLFAAPIYRSYGAAIGTGHYPGTAIGPAFGLGGVRRTLAEAQAAGIRMPTAETVRSPLEQATSESVPGEDWSLALARVARHR